MNPFKLLLTICLIPFLSESSVAQDKKPLDHGVYDIWKTLSRATITDDGKWVSYEVNAEKRDGFLYLYDWAKAERDSVPRGYKARFSADGQYLAFLIKAPKDSTRKAKLAKLKGDKLPKDSLGVWNTASKQIEKVPAVKSFLVPREGGNWMAYLTQQMDNKSEVEVEEDTLKQEEAPRKPSKKKNSKKKKKNLKTLVLWNPLSEDKQEIKGVESYQVAKNGAWIGWMLAKGDSIDSVQVSIFDTKNQTRKALYDGEGKGKRLVFDAQGTQASFMVSQDTGKVKHYDLWYWKQGDASAKTIATRGSAGIQSGWEVSEHGKTGFSEDGSRLYFGLAPSPVAEPEDTLLEEEKAKIDIWNWKDTRLQPQQSVELKKDQKKSYRTVWHVEGQKIVALGSESLARVDSLLKGNADIAMGIDERAYLTQRSWEWPSYRDLYAVDVNTGRSELLLEQAQYNNRLSPTGKYAYWYDIGDQDWHVMEVEGKQKRNLTQGLKVSFFNKLHNTPMEAYPYSPVGWTEDDRYFLVMDYFDIWRLDPSGKGKAVNLTKGMGRKNNIRFRYQKLDRESPFVDQDRLLLIGMQDETKEMGLYSVSLSSKKKPELLMKSANYYRNIIKARSEDRIIWRKESFQDYPDLYISNLDLSDIRKISHANPQQEEYAWGSVEMVHWTSYDGNQLAGKLYRPANFNPDQTYPMIVYFYERSSDGIHRYSFPSPSRSTVYPSIYTSNGYVIFVPDIVYETGQPGQDAYNAVMSGTDHILKTQGYVDSTRMALQGHSWGGYQIAHIVTQTDRYAAVMAGAPVSNMTSAYGGIRWGSGLSRMFQYEETQSRLGTTLWEDPDRYIKNSPLFFVPKIQTPILMMHNDKDGAVPWYQGIEFFVALRRLNKPVWMLVYNGEGHNLRGWANRKDLSIRMMQYFDHYLKGEEMPIWMSEGIPAVDKGKVDGFEIKGGR